MEYPHGLMWPEPSWWCSELLVLHLATTPRNAQGTLDAGRGKARDASRQGRPGDIAPRFYPVLSSLVAFRLPGWAAGATGAGAEHLA
jgi:hypothetical protein